MNIKHAQAISHAIRELFGKRQYVKPDVFSPIAEQYFLSTWQESLDSPLNYHGRKLLKHPIDVVNHIHLISLHQPQRIIETGTCFGGSALFFAHQMDALGRGEVITIDRNQADMPLHPRLNYIKADSATVRIPFKPDTMLVLDSDHRADHVLDELENLASLVTSGQLLVVEDSHLGHITNPDYGPGPTEAVEKWLPKHPEFLVITPRFLPSGNIWLYRV